MYSCEICVVFFICIGPLSGLLTNRFGHRPVAIIGSLVTMVGLTLSAFAATPYHLLFTFGIISGRAYNWSNRIQTDRNIQTDRHR